MHDRSSRRAIKVCNHNHPPGGWISGDNTNSCCIQNHVHYPLLTKWGTGSSGLFSAFTDKVKTHVRTLILQTLNGVIVLWIVDAGHVCRLKKLLV